VFPDANNAPTIGAFTCNSVDPLDTEGDIAPIPNTPTWHFVRVTYSGGQLALCVDGQKAMSKTFGSIKSTFAPQLGQNQAWTPQGAYVMGAVDDVRVVKGALPCD
jgi:hypothetical protein